MMSDRSASFVNLLTYLFEYQTRIAC